MKYVKQKDFEETYNKHINLDSIESIDIDGALEICGELIDASYYLRKEDGIKKAIGFLEKIAVRQLTNEQNGILYYYFGNAYADLDTFNQANSHNVLFDDRTLQV